MSIVSRMVSDLTGAEASQSEFVTLTVREHPATDQPKALDVLPHEIARLTQAAEVVLLELKRNGDTTRFAVTLADFRQVVPDDVVQRSRGTRGRRPGFSPGARRG